MFVLYPNLVSSYQKKQKETTATQYFLSKQTLKDMANFFRNLTGFDSNFDKVKEMFRKARKHEVFESLYIERSQTHTELKYGIVGENNPKKIGECIPERNAFLRR